VLQSNITLGQYNDETITLAITSAGLPWDLTGAAVQVVVKPAAAVADTDPAAITATVTITDAAAGLAAAVIPGDSLATAGRWYWHADVLLGGERKTALYGDVLIIPLSAAMPAPTAAAPPGVADLDGGAAAGGEFPVAGINGGNA